MNPRSEDFDLSFHLHGLPDIFLKKIGTQADTQKAVVLGTVRVRSCIGVSLGVSQSIKKALPHAGLRLFKQTLI